MKLRPHAWWRIAHLARAGLADRDVDELHDLGTTGALDLDGLTLSW